MSTFLLIPAQAGASGGGGSQMLIMISLMMVVVYFFMMRPQQKKAKEAAKFKDTLEKGSNIVTIGGIHAKIAEVKEKTFVVEIANQVKVEIEKTAVSMDLTKSSQAPPVPAKVTPAK